MAWNLSNIAAAQKTTFERPQLEGAFHARIDKAEVAVGKSSGTPYIKMQMSLFDIETGDEKGKAFPSLFPNSDSQFSMYQIARMCNAVGIDITDPNLSLDEQVFVQLIDKQELCVAITTKEKEYQGKKSKNYEPDFTNWDGYYPVMEEDKWNEVINHGATVSDEEREALLEQVTAGLDDMDGEEANF